jgi:hypothetical protein
VRGHDLRDRRSFLACVGAGGLQVALGGCSAAGSDSTFPHAGGAAAPAQFAQAAFPLRRKPGARYLVDQRDRPFLLHGDTAWSLMVQITPGEVEQYLDDRRARGFNTLLVSLLEHKYTSDPPRNRQGEGPFVVADDYSTPNERYFEHAAWVLRAAAQRGMLVLLTPSYIGCCGEDGWYAQMLKNGPQVMREYGRYLGRRFRGLDNIMWTHGGDGNPADQGIVSALAEGIREVDHVNLHTAHTGPGFQAKDIWATAPWLDVNNVYTYDPVAPIALRAGTRADHLPYFLIESEYEGENRRAPDVRIRAQAWQAMLNGAMGQVVGNNPIWHFASPRPITPFKGTWQQALDSEAARSMTQLRRLLESIEWWRLEPDADASFLVGGRCDGHYGAVAARSPEGDMALVYAPRRREIRVVLPPQAKGSMRARWVDPVSGASGSEFVVATVPGAPASLLPPAGLNAGGDTDLLLLLQATHH